LPSIAVTRQYEAIYILRPDSTEEQVETTVNKYRQIVTNFGGTVEKIDRWERRKLAYEVKGFTEGIYIVMEFSGESRTETELSRNFRISEDQIRYMIVKRDEGEVAAQAARAAAVPAAAPAPAPAPAPIAAAVEAPAAEVTAAPVEASANEETQAPVATEAVSEEGAATTEA
jgi:small subunit ribosomal protein S6